ncbi:hypothetical protein DSCW_61260 [Desulfosarcina widdelii]|uniref:Uncharacterized protein n=1 Tax=Desulfosarcina widdelii TaxID=947919 RepID=A0A5K7ZEY1_9BACT|nr:hypothetical protein DSCW_61260 [Desulfosarcina widdelii]
MSPTCGFGLFTNPSNLNLSPVVIPDGGGGEQKLVNGDRMSELDVLELSSDFRSANRNQVYIVKEQLYGTIL